MAPPRSELWQYVTIVRQASGPTGVKVVKCVFCLNEYKTNNATRISTHLENCKLVEGNSNVSKKRITKDKSKSVAPLDSAAASTSAKTSTSGSESTDVSSNTVRSRTGLAECRVLYESNATQSSHSRFSLVESRSGSHMLRATGRLRPGYKPPSRRQLNNQLLDDCYSSLQAEMSIEMSKATYVSLDTDAWTNVNGESVINFIVLLPQPVFYEAVYTTDNSHTADYLAKATAEIIHKIGTEVVSVVMDNAAAKVSPPDTMNMA